MSKVAYIRNILILVITTLGLLPLFVSTGGLYPNCDASYQILPLIIETKRMLSSGIPLWSWDTYLGDNFIGSYLYYTLTSPFALLNCLFPYKYIGAGFVICLYLKLMVCGYVSDRYFREIGFSRNMCVLGSLLYTFSTWGITNLYYYLFVEPMIVFPLLLIAVERLIKGKRYGCTVLMVTTAVTAMANYYFIPCNFIPAALYFFCRIFCGDFTMRQRRNLIFKSAGCVAVGMIAAAVVILPVLCHLQGSERASIHMRALWEYQAQRFQTLFIPTYVEGPFDFVLLRSSWSSNAATIAVFGCLPAIMLIVRRPKMYISVICMILILMYITPLNGVFSMFTNSDYSRWAYALTLFLSSATLYYFKDFRTIKTRYTVIYAAFCLLLYSALAAVTMYWRHKNGLYDTEPDIRIAALGALLVINLICLFMVCHSGASRMSWIKRALAATGLCAVVNMQMFACSVSPDTPLTSRKNYDVDTLYELKDKVDINDDARAHLIHDSEDATLYNWGIVTGCQGAESFHSLRNPLYSKVAFQAMHPNDHPNFLYAQNQKDGFNALMSVKHILRLDNDGNVVCTLNPHYIPMGFAYDKYCVEEEIARQPLNAVYNDSIFTMMLNALVIDSPDTVIMSKYMDRCSVNQSIDLDECISDRRKYTCDTFTPKSDGFEATISLPRAMPVFFSVVADPGFSAFVDSEKVPIYQTNLGFSTIIVPEGEHTITFKFMPRGFIPGLIITSICALMIWLTFIYEKRHYEKNIHPDPGL